ncbi:class I SAM-dependent DNA methyltransferase [Maribacter hydrothermalis]|uniref:site-specific DNA-methyltransferase (adenine-specific) n=1 Tax=Maribacter hydrothermalis TaxID=1836467 RepID=A0A1B7ZCI6_9FLAO|nr:DNA methyltransferase [Maribacter hydrothermalis]APQ18597.1 lactate dehydrogenase [Maribacter hydrothermalis]OBR40847.1 lactate dehydrogenase [Maribacter hydrothermalis]
MNAVEIEEAVSELALQPFEAKEFPFLFLEAFGNKDTTIKKLRSGSSNKTDVDGAILQRNNIHIATCKKGKVSETLDVLRKSPSTTKSKAEYILATDGLDFQAENIFSGETVACEYEDFHNYFGFFLSLANITTVKQIRESAFDIKATSRLNKLYVELLEHNPEWTSIERRPDMNHFLARLIFCFFAEDTDIFREDDLFTDTVQKISDSNASNTHEVISEIFRAMDTKLENRDEEKIKVWGKKFPYVNGELFSGSIDVPKFTKIARSYLLHVGSLDWKQINPDIFGSMIQAVADEDERGSLGMHYTSVPNILKVLNPLFLDDLREHLEKAEDNSRKLLNLRNRMARIRVFDPACGSGNFLVIAYKEMRKIENEINLKRGEKNKASEIPLTNFRGIELKDFSAEVARLALIIAEYQCDVLYRGQSLALAEFLPLDAQNWITKGNALTINWLSVCPPMGTGVKLLGDDLFSTPLDQAEIDFDNEGGETYICGNPPYLGSTWQSKEQKADLESIFSKYTKQWKTLDYVSGWFMKAAEFANNTDAASAFVSTNSICQGQHVPILWPIIFKAGHKINFAHTSFKWANLASYNAGVTVIIVGISKSSSNYNRLFSINDSNETVEKKVNFINAYLIDGQDVIVRKLSKPLSGVDEMTFGSKPVDGGNLLLDKDELTSLKLSQTEKVKYVKRIYGSSELISDKVRYCLWINDKDIDTAKRIRKINDRIEAVKEMRLASKKAATQKGADYPHRFDEKRQNGNELLIVVPAVSSGNRNILPCGFLKPGNIITNRNFALFNAALWNFAIIVSKLHYVWIDSICGKLRTDFNYSNTLGWNTFPIPTLTKKNKEDLTTCVEEILISRERHFPATIADLYNPDKMPEDLRQAHKRNDEVLERIYIGRKFKNDTERLEKLFQLYTKMTSEK